MGNLLNTLDLQNQLSLRGRQTMNRIGSFIRNASFDGLDDSMQVDEATVEEAARRFFLD